MSADLFAICRVWLLVCACLVPVVVSAAPVGSPPPKAAVQPGDYLIGTYYFPGWTEQAPGLEHPRPWQPILPYTDRVPLLGYYSDSDPAVLRQQAAWMKQFGIDYVVFDWYWDGKASYLEHAVRAFEQIWRPGDVRFALMWANHYKFPGGLAEYRAMVTRWVREHFNQPGYLRLGGRPVMFIFGVDAFADAAKTIGLSPAELVHVANSISRAAGQGEIFFVGGTPALAHWVRAVAPAAGFGGLSAYNYHNAFSGSAESAQPQTEGYPALDQAYRTNWQWIVKNSPIPYVIPMTSGWDKRPWGGSSNPRHDQSVATPAQFEAHLRAAKALMDAAPPSAMPKMGVICCWNEYGEGSFIEPTRRDGTIILEQVQKVFGGGAP